MNLKMMCLLLCNHVSFIVLLVLYYNNEWLFDIPLLANYKYVLYIRYINCNLDIKWYTEKYTCMLFTKMGRSDMTL